MNRSLRTITIFLFSFVFFTPFVNAQEQGIIINEFTNGPSGTKEYIEFLVVGCPGGRVDIRGWKFDDNNGDFSNGPTTGKGIAPGHSRFSMHTQWASVPVGSLILVYNSGDKNGSITLPDDPSDTNIDSVYVLSHDYSNLIEVCNNTPVAQAGNLDATYISCTAFGSGSWTTIGMRNDGDATQVRRPDGTYFHGFGYGDNTGGPDNLQFPGSGTNKAYSYTSSSCNYRDISNFTAMSASTGETPGRSNNASNLSYIRFLREGIRPGTIASNQSICNGSTPALLTESGAVIRCYVNYQWQSSATGAVGTFANISGAINATYAPPALTTTTYYRRVVTNICQHDTSNIVAITVTPAIGRADQPSIASTSLCINPANDNVTTNPVTGASGYNWQLIPSGAGTITGTTTSATIDWNNTYTGIAKIVVKAQGCGGNQPSDTTFVTISNGGQAQAGSDQLSICGTSATLGASAGTGSWSIQSGNGGNVDAPTTYNSTFTGVAGETYTLRWTVPASACMIAGSDDVQISFVAPPASPITTDTSTCSESSVTLKASGGSNGQYRWYNSTSGTAIAGQVNDSYQTPVITANTTYYVALNNGSCESAKVPVNITIGAGNVSAGPDINTVKGASVTLQGSGNGTFSWSPSTTLNDPTIATPVAKPQETTTYVLTMKAPGGCVYKDSMTVYILCDQVYLPNLITPNGDDKNDSFIIGCASGAKWDLQISNRWGDIVYQNSNYNNEWKAEGLGNGVYYFMLRSDDLNVSYKGWVQVLN